MTCKEKPGINPPFFNETKENMSAKYTFSQIDELLVKEAFVKPEDIEKAYKIRAGNIEKSKISLGSLLIKKKLLTKDSANKLLAHPVIQQHIEKAILDKRLMTRQQLTEFLGENHRKFISVTTLVKQGYIAEDDFKQIIQEQLDTIIFGKLAIKHNLITEKDLEDILEIKKYKKSISEILCDMHLITLAELNHVFRKFNKQLKLGKILIQQELITEKQIEEALEEQTSRNDTLGKILVRKKIITVDQLYFALSIQYCTPFQELNGFVFYEKQKIELRNIAGQKFADEYLMLPLFLSGNYLTLAVSNPVNILNKYELMSINIHLHMNCILITNEKFEQLYALLYGEMIDSFLLLSENSRESVSPGKKSVITNPENQTWLLNNLFKRYEILNSHPGKNHSNIDANLFNKFIEDSFNSICSKYNCNGVSFWFEIKNDGVEIKASPLSNFVM